MLTTRVGGNAHDSSQLDASNCLFRTQAAKAWPTLPPPPLGALGRTAQVLVGTKALKVSCITFVRPCCSTGLPSCLKQQLQAVQPACGGVCSSLCLSSHHLDPASKVAAEELPHTVCLHAGTAAFDAAQLVSCLQQLEAGCPRDAHPRAQPGACCHSLAALLHVFCFLYLAGLDSRTIC